MDVNVLVLSPSLSQHVFILFSVHNQDSLSLNPCLCPFQHPPLSVFHHVAPTGPQFPRRLQHFGVCFAGARRAGVTERRHGLVPHGPAPETRPPPRVQQLRQRSARPRTGEYSYCLFSI